MRLSFTALALSAISLAGCGGSDLHPKLFSAEWTDDGGASIAALRTKLHDAPFTRGADVVVAVSESGDRVIGLPMIGGQKWSFKHALDSRPQVAGNLVVGSGGGELFAIDATTGKQVWTRSTGGLPVRGAGDDGNLTAVTLGKPESAGSVLLVIARDGSVKRQVETDKVLGVPAVLGGYVFVPWSNQYVSAFDSVTGEEVARITLREKVSRAWTQSAALYFGELGIFRFDDKIKDASKNGASHITLPERELPGTPRLLVPGTERVPTAANAFDEARLYARPSAGETSPLSVDSHRFYATYYRIVMGFDSQSGKLGFVAMSPADVIGGDAVPGGLVTCDEDGKVKTLDARTGSVLKEVTLGEPVKSCLVSLDSYKAEGSPAAPPGSLADQITRAVTSREATLATAQRLLLRELATLPDESATKTLLDLVADPRTAPVVVADARAAVSSRRSGANYMVSALGRHYDYLKDVLVSPAVGPIAEALAAMNVQEGAAPIATFLADPNITEDDVKRAAAALVTLATPAELPSLKKFFSLYRAGADTEDMAQAVASAAQAILRLDPKDGHALVLDAAKDPLTRPIVKPKLDAILFAVDAANADGQSLPPGATPPASATSATPPKRNPPKK